MFSKFVCVVLVKKTERTRGKKNQKIPIHVHTFSLNWNANDRGEFKNKFLANENCLLLEILTCLLPAKKTTVLFVPLTWQQTKLRARVALVTADDIPHAAENHAQHVVPDSGCGVSEHAQSWI